MQKNLLKQGICIFIRIFYTLLSKPKQTNKINYICLEGRLLQIALALKNARLVASRYKKCLKKYIYVALVK